MKISQFFILATVIVAFMACSSKTDKHTGNGGGTWGTQTEEAAEATGATGEVTEGDMGPGTVSCDKFSVVIPVGWKVRNISNNVIGVGEDNKEGLSLVYDGRTNYQQAQQVLMNNKNMLDLGERTYGENKYATFLLQQESGDSFSAILKIGDGKSSVVKVSTTNVNSGENETVINVLRSLRLK